MYTGHVAKSPPIHPVYKGGGGTREQLNKPWLAVVCALDRSPIVCFFLLRASIYAVHVPMGVDEVSFDITAAHTGVREL